MTDLSSGNNRSGLYFWICFHLILGVVALSTFPFKVNTDLMSILPESKEMAKLDGIEKEYNNRLGSSMTILIGTREFNTSKEIGSEFFSNLQEIEGLQNVTFGLDEGLMDRYGEFLFKSRYNILTPGTADLIRRRDIQQLSERALMTVFGPVSLVNLDNLEEDPFLLTSDSLIYYLNKSLSSNSAMTVKDSVMTRELDGVHWVLITMNTESSTTDIKVKKSPIPAVLDEYEYLRTKYPQSEILLSGGPFHSYLSTVESQKQISLLSTVSGLFVILLILVVYRSMIPLVSTVLAIVFGMLSGFASTLIVFQEIHIFTIVFGTSLIGISVDYSFHYFSEWSSSSLDGKKVRLKVLPGICIGLITTIISYGAFIITEFPLLQQMALFSCAGLISTFLSVTLVFPHIAPPGVRTMKCTNSHLRRIGALNRMRISTRLLYGILAALVICTLITGLTNLHLSSQLSDFYTMSEKMKNWEMKSASILAHESSGVHLIIQSDSLEGCLQEEETLSRDLETLIKRGDLKSSLALSMFLPSKRTQDINNTLVEDVLLPSVPEQLRRLGLPVKNDITMEHEYTGLESITKILPPGLLKSLNIGAIDEKYYTSILLFGVREKGILRSLNDKYDNIFLVDRIGDTENVLKDLNATMVKIILLSYLLIFTGLIVRYRLMKAFIIICIPLISSLTVLSLFNLTGIPINLFVLVGLILIPGMGTDYLIFLFETKKDESRVLLSISMSFLTTFLSFGMLSFTSIASTFGMTVSIGILCTFLLTLLASAGFRINLYKSLTGEDHQDSAI